MKAGSELDVLMAEVMGWELLTVGYFGGQDETSRQVVLEDWLDEVGAMSVGDYWIDVPKNICVAVEDWKPSTDMNAAMQVAMKVCNWDVDDNMLILRGQGPDIEKKKWPDGEAAEWWEAEINGTWDKVVAEADRPALAICLAVRKLKEMGIEK